MTDANLRDPVLDFAVGLVTDVARRSHGLASYLLAKAADLPANPFDAEAVLAARWPRLTAEERQLAVRAAAQVLRATAEDCTREAAILETLMEDGGNG